MYSSDSPALTCCSPIPPRPSPLFAAQRAQCAHIRLANLTTTQLDRHRARTRVEATQASAPTAALRHRHPRLMPRHQAGRARAPLRSKRGRNDVEDTSTTTTTTDDDESSDAEEDVGEHNRPGPDSRNTSAEGVSWSYCILTLYDDSMSHVLNADHSRGLCASMTGKPSASRSARRTF